MSPLSTSIPSPLEPVGAALRRKSIFLRLLLVWTGALGDVTGDVLDASVLLPGLFPDTAGDGVFKMLFKRRAVR